MSDRHFFVTLSLVFHSALAPNRVRRDLNPRPATLEIAALPAELHTPQNSSGGSKHCLIHQTFSLVYYARIFVIVPAPIVRPPSRIANLIPSSIATGQISSPVNSTLSPGITISVPSGRVTVPVTSVVRKKN